jgi:hypothetical protein
MDCITDARTVPIYVRGGDSRPADGIVDSGAGDLVRDTFTSASSDGSGGSPEVYLKFHETGLSITLRPMPRQYA